MRMAVIRVERQSSQDLLFRANPVPFNIPAPGEGYSAFRSVWRQAHHFSGDLFDLLKLFLLRNSGSIPHVNPKQRAVGRDISRVDPDRLIELLNGFLEA